MTYLETMSVVCPLLGVSMDSTYCFMTFGENRDPYTWRIQDFSHETMKKVNIPKID